MMRFALLGLCLSLGLAPALAQAQQAPAARGNFMDPQGRNVGTARLTQTPHGVLILIEVSGLPPGPHAFHVHAVGRCEGAGGFQSAAGHYNPGDKQHGFEVGGGPHAGDMPNLFIGSDGMLRAEVLNPGVTLGAGPNSVFDADGSALVIHANADDHRSQPAGDAGGRIACAVVERGG